MSKYIYISLFFFITLCNKTVAQQPDENNKVDTTEFVESDTVTEAFENEDKEANTLFFENIKYDTFKVNTRFYADDSIAFYKNQADFIYPIDENNVYFNRNKNSRKADTVTTSQSNNDDYSSRRNSNINFSFLNIIIWIIIIVFLILVIVMYLKDNNINMFAKRAKAVEVDSQINYDNIFEIDYINQIENAFNNGNYNIAARLGFLRLLKLLSEKKVIVYGIEKTNFDYQFQLINTKYYQKFNAAAVSYDYAWYSGIIISNNQYQQIVQQYRALENLL